jgi:uncharacterized membrane protein (DUF485 family)
MAATGGHQGTQGRVPPEHANVDWERAERSPEFQELVQKRRSFVIPATIFFLVWFLAFILLAGYARDFMGERVTGGLTVGYLIALTQFLMVWVLAFAYIRRAESTYDPLARRAADRALSVIGTEPPGGERLVTPAAGPEARTVGSGGASR